MKIYPAGAEAGKVPTSTMPPTQGASQCEGRLVRDGPKGEWMLPFQEGEGTDERDSTTWFHVPIRCDRVGVIDGLCTACYERAERTRKKVEAIRGTTIGAMHPSLLHGRVGEPVPFWSHIIGGAWFNLKIETGYRVHEAVMARAKKAIEAAEGVGAVMKAEAAPAGTTRRGRKPKGSGTAVPVAPAAEAAPSAKPITIQQHLQRAAAVEQERTATKPAPASAPSPVPAPTPPKKKAPKQAVPTAPKPSPAVGIQSVATGYVEDTRSSPVEDVTVISVRHLTLSDGRNCYLDPVTQNVYDKAFKWFGQYSAETGTVN